MSGCGFDLVVRRLGFQPYEATWRSMRDFTEERTVTTPDEAWLLEHPPVFTLGQAGRREHLIRPGRIPVVATDRGGQVTYHGPGQLVVYLLIDLRRRSSGVRRLVQRIEDSVIDLLEVAGVRGERRPRAPGVYVDGRKVAALGLRVRRGCTYHGLSLNVDMDLGPFSRIDPCGYAGLEVTSLARLGVDWDVASTGERLMDKLATRFGARVRNGRAGCPAPATEPPA